MKRKLPIIIAVLLLAVTVLVAGCTESLKQDAISTQFSDAVGKNGGMAVTYGNYLYFINGYAGESAANTFGEVVKGSVARVSLKNGVPDGEPQIIVPKNVYGTDTKYGGIYISGDYIYYMTTNTELNGEGAPKTSEGVLMRTKVDGTDTKEVKKFDDHSVVFVVKGNNLVYIRSNAVYAIDITSKDFNETTVVSNINSGYVMDDNYLYFLTTDAENSSNQLMNVYPLAGGEPKAILSASIMGKEDTTYTFSILSTIDEGESVKIFYSKVDGGLNSPETGIYSCSFAKSDFAYSANNEVRYTRNSTSTTNLAYTAFYKAGPYYLGLASTKFDAFNADGTRVAGSESFESLNIGSASTYFDLEEVGNDVYLYYLNSNVLYKIRIMTKDGENYAFVEDNAIKVFSGSYNTSFTGMKRIGNVIYYFNSGISNNAYYYVMPTEVNSDTDTAKGKILGIITETDIIAAF